MGKRGSSPGLCMSAPTKQHKRNQNISKRLMDIKLHYGRIVRIILGNQTANLCGKENKIREGKQ